MERSGDDVTRPQGEPLRASDSHGAAREPIAIIGTGCRFPGAEGPEAFWRFLCAGGDAIREVPASRFRVEDVYDPRPATPGRINTRWGGFLDDIDRFDAAFFGISPREAARMDPQQRLLLEVSVGALEDAGLAVEKLQGSPTGVFVGILSSDFSERSLSYPPGLDVYAAAGSELSVAAGRISYALGFQGPSFSINAACASSLVAAHLACQSLWSGESTLALAAGTNLILRPEPSIPFAQAGMLAADGRCKFCSAHADGFVRSEGAGAVVLKPLGRALADGDPIYAVIRGSACNNDGRSGGLLMTPSQAGQEAALREAYRNAGVSPGTVHYVEAHGTGTRAGDPVELGALARVMGEGRPPGSLCRVGSVKTNVGHLEGAAGIAGLIKAALCVKHRALPPTLHCEELNPDIPWHEIPLRPQRSFESLPAGGGPFRVGVSSAGINGANAHLVLEEAPAATPALSAAPAQEPPRAQLLPLSAQTPEALRELARAWCELLEPAGATQPPPLADLCYSAAVRRSAYEHAVGVVADSHAGMAAELRRWLDGAAGPGSVSGRRSAGARPKLAFVFSGQGSQWLGMGRELFAQEPVFRAAVEACAEALRPWVDWSLLDELHASEADSRLGELGVIQPVIFAMQVALARLLHSWGLEPDVLVGQSLGEVAAACVGGALDLDDAARVICARSRLVDASCGRGRGGMAVVGLSLAAAREAIAPYGARLSIAVSSGPTSTIVSGDPDALDALQAELERREVFAGRIAVDYASHSAQMDPVREDLLRALEGIRPRMPAIPIHSTVTAELLGELPMDPLYWWRNLRDPVLFEQVLEALLDSGHTLLVEISPHPVVASGIQQGLRHLGREALVVSTLRRGEDARAGLLASLGAIHAAGGRVDWERFHGPERRFVPLPRYPWQRERHWFPEDEALARYRHGAAAGTGHPLLGRRFSSAHHPGTHFFETELGTELLFYLADHRFQDVAVLPGAAYLEMALAAAHELYGPGPHALEDVRFEAALFLPDGATQRVQLCVTPGMAGTAHFELFSREPAGAQDAQAAAPAELWTLHARGRICIDQGAAAEAEPADLAALRAACGARGEGAEHYAAMATRGLPYGPSFQGVQEVWRRDGEALGRIRLPELLVRQAGDYRFHPALLDACLQVSEACMPRDDARVAPTDAYLPVGIERLELRAAPGSELWAHTRSRLGADADFDRIEGDLCVRDAEGRLVLEARGLRMQRVDRARGDASDSGFEDWLYEMRWRPLPLPAEAEAKAAARLPGGSWLLFAEREELAREPAGEQREQREQRVPGVTDALAAFLEARGEACVRVEPGAGFECVAPGRYRVDPLEPGDFRKLFGDVFGGEGAPCRGVVHLWNLDLAPGGAIDAQALEALRTRGCISVVHAVQAALDVEWARDARLWLVTRGAHPVGEEVEGVALAQAPVWGLGRVAAHELPELHCTRVDLDPRGGGADVEALCRELFAGDREEELAFRGGQRHVYRLLRRAAAARRAALANVRRRVPLSEPFRLELPAVGLLDEIRFRQVPRPAPGPEQLEIQVKAAALNFRDLLLAMGVLPEEIKLGWECAGVVSAVGANVRGFAVGDEVLSFAPDSFASYAITDAVCAVKKPARLSFEEAAALPIVFFTAIYCLETLARLRPGERILIHSAAGGVGLAAIQIARRLGAEIYATAGNEEKRAYLRSLGVRHVMDSRSFAWVDELKAVTDGQGVDVVLNFLEGEAIPKGLSVLRPFGRFVEIGKKDLFANSRLGLAPFLNNLQFLVMEGYQISQTAPALYGEGLRALLPAFEDGTLQPLPVNVFPFSQAADAFRLMAQAKHIGKIVLSFAGESEMSVAPPALAPAAIRPDATYLITGGLGGLGLEVAAWMVREGARHLALMGRSAPSPAARAAIAALEAQGAQVRVVAADVSVEAQVRDVLAKLRASGPPLRGVVHSAVVLEDGILAQLERSSFRKVMAPKVEGSWWLHRHSLEDPLDFFVLFSSAASFLGSPGQGNYAAANSFQDGLAFYRRIQGLPALTINWGPWSEVGQAAAQANRGERLEQRGVSSIHPEQGVRILERLLREEAPQVAAIPFDVEQWCQFYPAAAESPLLADLLSGASGGASAGGGALSRAAIAACEPPERLAVVQDYLSGILMRVLQLEGSRIDPDQSLNRMGLDSLMAMELRNRVQADLEVALPIVKLLKGGTVAELARWILELVESELEEPAGAAPALDPLVAELESLSDEEAERLLAAEEAAATSGERGERIGSGGPVGPVGPVGSVGPNG